ncbi:hypothetical protein FOZ62_003704, partial [Perkinsus olseni]
VLSSVPERGQYCPHRGDAAEGEGGYLKNSKVAGGEAECVQGCRANPSCEYAVYYPDSGYCKWSEDCPRLLRTKQHDTRLWRRVEQGMAAQQESLRPENLRMRAAVGAHDAYSVRVLGDHLVENSIVAEYRASGSAEGTALAYQWASYGADILGDYQCMYERAMMDAVDRKHYALAVGRLLNLSRLPAVIFPWEVNPLDQFADPELEAKVMDMLIENDPWAAAAADLGGISDEEELQEMRRPGAAGAAPPPHVTASMLGIVAAVVAYAADCCRCGLRALTDVRQHALLSAFQFECPFIKAPEGWPSPVMVQLAVIVLVFVPVLLSFTILSRKLLRRMVIQGVPEAPDHQHQDLFVLLATSMARFSRAAVLMVSFIVLHRVHAAKLKRPDEEKERWVPKANAAAKDVDYSLFANGRGKVKVKDGKSDCDGKWKDAETYGARKKTIKQFCIRLHEKHQDDKGYTDAPKRYDCRLDPNDKGNDHGRKNRDWLCYEKNPKYVLLPPHGPELNATCPTSWNAYEHRAILWYPKDSPPSWCHYNWYENLQVCWCMPGFYRDSPYDTTLNKRACPDGEEIFIAPRFVSRDTVRQLQAADPNTGLTDAGEECSCSAEFP